MDEKNWQNVKEIFLAALEKTGGEEREDFLSGIGNNEIRAEVESLLVSHAEIEDFIEEPAFQVAEVFTKPSANRTEKHFGNYKIIKEIGVGGMGAVFLAERDDGEFSQKVAVKIIRQTVADSELVNRFRRERQILANLNHPNIAKLVDGGVSASGEPFLAMEFVEGEAITKFVARENLDLEARLKLFLKVCAAVSYAHRNLIVHRDLKPGNILVTAENEPKLLDFGLAKLLDANLLNDPEQTQTAFRALTPAYASPEQLKNEPITTASDIYSLGVIFYELLTGERPFQFEGKSLDEIIKTATEREPVRPSSFVLSPSQDSEKQRTKDKGRRTKVLKGDLDNIALTALKKEPVRRYQSVEAFSGDIERHLKGLPVAARPNTYKYRASKYIKRHKIGVLAASLILLSLIGGIIVSIWQAQAARNETAKAETVNRFLAEMLNYSDPNTAVEKDENELITIKDVLDKAAKHLEDENFSAQPDVKAQLNYILGYSYNTQGFYEPAEKHIRASLEKQIKIFGGNNSEIIQTKLLLASILAQRGKRSETDEILQEIIPLARVEVKKGNLEAVYLVNALESFAVNRRALGNSREAENLLREALALEPSVVEKDKNALSVIRGTLTLTLFDQGKIDEAIALQSEHINELSRTAASETWELGYAFTSLGSYLSEKGNFVEADENLSKGETIYRRLLSNSHLFLGDNLRLQANSLYRQNKFAEAETKIAETLKIYRANTNEQYINFATALMIQGLILNKTEKSVEAEKILREAVGIRQKNLPPEHFLTALAKSALGECLMTQKKFSEAETLLVQSFESLKVSQGAENPRTQLAKSRLAELYEKTGR